MRLNLSAPTFLLFLLTTAAGPLNAMDLTFLDQAPLAFLSDADIQRLEETISDALDTAKDGESRSWTGSKDGNSGTVTAVRSFENDGNRCRRIEVVTLAPKAADGRGRSVVDMCQVDSEWKILRLP